MKRGKRKSLHPRVCEIPATDLDEIVNRARSGPLNEEDCTKLRAAVETLNYMTQEIIAKNASLRRLRNILFGAKTEKTEDVLKKKEKDLPASDSEKLGDPGIATDKPERKKRKGHGRNSAAAYRGAKHIKVTHAKLKHGSDCPDCEKGKVYGQKKPAFLVRVTGMAPINADVYECDRFRCNCCGKIFTAEAPDGVGEKKYDESVTAMVALFKYGAGVPFHRLEKLQAGLGIPLPAGTQWDLIDGSVEQAEPAYIELIRQAAQGKVLHNDDTTMKILNYDTEALAETREEKRKRTGTFTSGIISEALGHRIALFFTGRNHAGENLARVLKHREEKLSRPIQMCDALSRNTTGDFKTILGNCLAHARRRFVDVIESFPDECELVLKTLREVYRNDKIARDRGDSPEERLRFHEEKSGSLMKDLEKWLQEQFDENKVEPNSTLGEAIKYMLNHWNELTLFLREPGAPLDNNICERALKKAILNRKNAYFYKTENGARVGDMYMSLIHTTELNDENPFEYLVALQRHSGKVKENPAGWMPWNFREALTSITSGPDPPS